MRRDLPLLGIAAVLSATMAGAEPALAQKPGGILKIGQFDSPASMSIHEESSNTAEGPMMGVFNNLVLYDQHVAQNSLASIRPDLATDWSWDEDRNPADISAAPWRRVARRQALHCTRCQVHL